MTLSVQGCDQCSFTTSWVHSVLSISLWTMKLYHVLRTQVTLKKKFVTNVALPRPGFTMCCRYKFVNYEIVPGSEYAIDIIPVRDQCNFTTSWVHYTCMYVVNKFVNNDFFFHVLSISVQAYDQCNSTTFTMCCRYCEQWNCITVWVIPPIFQSIQVWDQCSFLASYSIHVQVCYQLM